MEAQRNNFREHGSIGSWIQITVCIKLNRYLIGNSIYLQIELKLLIKN